MKKEIRLLIAQAIQILQRREHWGDVVIQDFQVEHPQSELHGDYAVNVAMKLSSVLRKNPVELGAQIVEVLENNSDVQRIFKRVEVVPPGFVNFYFHEDFLARGVEEILLQDKNFGRSAEKKNQKVQVEFISANPTGPLHMGNGRGGFTGDTLANVLSQAGFTVRKEYYLNDRGVQIDRLGESVTRRWLQQQGVPVPYPEDLYQGEYVREIAGKLSIRNYKLQNIKKIERIKKTIREKALEVMISEIQTFVQDKLKIKYHQWFSEKSLFEHGDIQRVLTLLRARGHVVERDGALWLETTKYGDDKDRVLVKANGEYTYFLSDVAYLWHRLIAREFDRVIVVLGADHHGYIRRLQAAAKILGKPDAVDVIIVQLVRLMKDGQEVRMSKRAGNFVTLEELVDDVGLDAARFFFLMNAPGTHMDFDLNLAKQQTNENPVYYVQYAHARICQILSKATKTMNAKRIVYESLTYSTPEEWSLIRELIKLPELVEEISRTSEVHRLPFYAMEVARKFHVFYTKHRVIDEGKVNVDRLALVRATKTVLKNTLSLMGISAPTRL